MSTFDIVSFKPLLIDNFFTEQHINHITEFINSQIDKNIKNYKDEYFGFENNKKLGCFTYTFTKEDIKTTRDYVSQEIKRILGIDIHPGFIDLKYQRYTSKTGNSSPELGPHVDKIDDKHYMSFSLPINNKEIWPLYLDIKKYNIQNNQALFFNVSNTIHWRPKKIFLENEHYDVLILRFYEPGNHIFIDTDFAEKIETKARSIITHAFLKNLDL